MDEGQPHDRPAGGGEAATGMTDGGSAACDRAQWFSEWPARAEEFLHRHHRPLVTVSYAQSVDGSIASRAREQLLLSSSQSLVLTHRIRAACDAVVIGINTLLADNPLLTVRLAAGPSPQPIVLDTNLRMPLQARLLDRPDLRCWVACAHDSDPERAAALEGRGAVLLRCQRDRHGRVDLPSLLALLGARGIRSIMVEGGAEVISSFIEARLVDQLIITIAPRLVGGLPVLDRPAARNGSRLQLESVVYQACGPDIILWAQPHWLDP